MAKLQLTQEELKNFYQQDKTMIWQYKTLYQICYSLNAGYYFTKVTRKNNNVTKRGRFMAMATKQAHEYLYN